jgi:hypothetical protein
MDPYLDRFWLSVHNKLVTYLSDELNGLLPADLRAEMTERVLISSGEDAYRRRILPDVYVVERAPGLGAAPAEAGGVAVAEPLLITFPDDPIIETAIRITDLSGERLITAIEVLSASNKRAGGDRDQYLRKRDEYFAGGVNLVEIDLYRGGERTVSGVDDVVPPARRTPYLVLVRRATRFVPLEVYPLPLRQRLPALPVPLRPGEADVIVDIQPLIDRVYANGRYPIDYGKAPEPPLHPDDEAWADELLRTAGRR